MDNFLLALLLVFALFFIWNNKQNKFHCKLYIPDTTFSNTVNPPVVMDCRDYFQSWKSLDKIHQEEFKPIISEGTLEKISRFN